jgi:hypothetical protein
MLSIISIRMRWAGHVARMGDMRNSYKGRDHSKDLGVDEEVII